MDTMSIQITEISLDVRVKRTGVGMSPAEDAEFAEGD
jgi:hypothetical protein